MFALSFCTISKFYRILGFLGTWPKQQNFPQPLLKLSNSKLRSFKKGRSKLFCFQPLKLGVQKLQQLLRQKHLCLAQFGFVEDQLNVKKNAQPPTFDVESWRPNAFFYIWTFMDHSKNLFKNSMRGRNKYFCSAFHGTPKQLAQVIMKGFRVLFLKVEAKQSNFP